MNYGIKINELNKNKDDYYFCCNNKNYCMKRIYNVEEIQKIIKILNEKNIEISALKNKHGRYITYINDKIYILAEESIKEEENIIIIGQVLKDVKINISKIDYFKKEDAINNIFKLFDEYSIYLLLKGLELDMPMRVSINHMKYDTIFYESLINYKIGYFACELANIIKNEIIIKKMKKNEFQSINKRYNLNKKELYVFYSTLFAFSKEEKEKITNNSDLKTIYEIMCEFIKEINDEIKILN